MVAPAEQNEVVELRFTPGYPVPDVVRIEETAVLAAGKAAASVAHLQRSPHGSRDRARLSAHGQRFPVAFDELHERGVASNPPRRLLGHRGAVFQRAGALAGLDVHDDLVALTACPTLDLAPERHVRQGDERLRVRRPSRFRGTALFRFLALLEPMACRLERAQEECPVLGCEAGAKNERAVLIPRIADVGRVLERTCLLGRHSPVSADGALELGGG